MLVAIGDDLRPDTILAAYRRGLFPMPVEPDGPIGWWSPDPRGVLEPSQVHVSRSMSRFMSQQTSQLTIRVNTAFEDVIDACADPDRPHGWIDQRIRAAYVELHQLGWGHSIEAWRDDRLVGGLYGLAIGGLFAGESMFHHEANASKAVLIALARHLDDGRPRLIDVQWCTDHLASMGVVEISRRDYAARLPELFTESDPSLDLGGSRPMEAR